MATVNTSLTQQALANDGAFRARIKNALATIAWQVLGEDPATTGHGARTTYARQVLGALDQAASFTAGWIVVRPNVFQTNVTVGFDPVTTQIVVTTDATDAALQSQIATDWSLIAGA